jgi:glutamyl-tRNA(Gln) amidotransferase subunit E
MDLDYEKHGFKCGIEIHQQLDTHKLFCSCPPLIREDKPDIIIDRRMRAVAGELGDVDPAALHEFLRNRILEYEAYSDSNCLVELDEEPPHPLNKEALEIVIQASLLLGARVVDEIQVMRKTVIDGSNTSGFQRTMLVAVDGRLETSMGVVGIPTICLEEDAARIIDTKGGRVVYRLDRLGIPLVEIATTPEIRNPGHAREVAEKIGSILRACKVKRGLGTIRQDLNVSIAGGQRIEVKGVQDLKLINKVLEGEVQRQLKLIEVMKELEERKVKEKDFNVTPVDVTKAFANTKAGIIKKAVESGGVVKAVKLTALNGLLKDRLGPELAQYVRASSMLKGLFHSDELPAEGVSPREVESVKESVNAGKGDAFAMVAGSGEEVEKALDAVLDRCRTAFKGVPEETRRAFDDGSTEYMRPLPGSARMYPETDEPLVPLPREYVDRVGEGLPELREEKAKRYEKLGLSAELAGQVAKSGKAGLFEKLVSEYPEVNPTLIAAACFSAPKEAASRYAIHAASFTNEHYKQVVDLLNEAVISQNVLPELYFMISGKSEARVKEIVEKERLHTVGGRELEAIVDKVVEDNKDLVEEMGTKAAGPLTGKVMAEVKGRADARKVRKLVEEKLE